MAFIFLMLALGAVGYLIQRLRGGALDWRSVMRYGMGAAFIFTGTDHFLNLETRYLPMIPTYMSAWGWQIVVISGVLELAGGVGLLVPSAGWKRLGLPNLRPIAGIGLAMLMSVMVVANAHVAETAGTVAGLPSSQTYLALRPLLQPFLILWALLCSEAVYPPPRR